MPAHVRAERLRRRPPGARRLDHPRRDRVVRVLVDQDERAGGAVGGVRVGDDGRARAQPDPPDVVEREAVGGLDAVAVDVDPAADLLERRAHAARRVLEQVARRRSGPASRPSSTRWPRARAPPAAGRSRSGDEVAAADVEVVLERERGHHRRERALDRAARRVDRRDPRPRAVRQHDDLVAARAARRRRRGRRTRGSRRRGSPTGRGSGRRRGCGRARPRRVSRCSSSGGPSYHGHARPRPRRRCRRRSAEIGIGARVGDAELLAERAGSRARSRGTAARRSRRGPSC